MRFAVGSSIDYRIFYSPILTGCGGEGSQFIENDRWWGYAVAIEKHVHLYCIPSGCCNPIHDFQTNQPNSPNTNMCVGFHLVFLRSILPLTEIHGRTQSVIRELNTCQPASRPNEWSNKWDLICGLIEWRHRPMYSSEHCSSAKETVFSTTDSITKRQWTKEFPWLRFIGLYSCEIYQRDCLS